MSSPQYLKRWMMHQTLAAHTINTNNEWNARPISQQDSLLLGKLMYESYHNTIDDQGETPEEATQEIEDTLRGKYGPLFATCSFVLEDQEHALGATILTDWTDKRTGKKQPLLTFLMTHPNAIGKGIATFLLKKSINALLAQREQELVLFVTVGNNAAQHIYQKLGFQVVEELETKRIKPI